MHKNHIIIPTLIKLEHSLKGILLAKFLAEHKKE